MGKGNTFIGLSISQETVDDVEAVLVLYNAKHPDAEPIDRNAFICWAIREGLDQLRHSLRSKAKPQLPETRVKKIAHVRPCKKITHGSSSSRPPAGLLSPPQNQR